MRRQIACHPAPLRRLVAWPRPRTLHKMAARIFGNNSFK
jgi:hypothetical protein